MTQTFSSDQLANYPSSMRTARHNAIAMSASDSPNANVPTGAEIEHFDVLLEAVVERLEHAADGLCTDANWTTPEQTLACLRSTVLECVEALEQLQATQRHVRSLNGGADAFPKNSW